MSKITVLLIGGESDGAKVEVLKERGFIFAKEETYKIRCFTMGGAQFHIGVCSDISDDAAGVLLLAGYAK